MKFSTALAPRGGPRPDGCGQRRHAYAAEAPGRRLQGATARSATGGEASTRTRKRHRGSAAPLSRTRCRTVGSDSSAAAWGRSTPGSRGRARPAPARSRRASLAQRRAQTGVEVLAELGGRRTKRPGEGPGRRAGCRRAARPAGRARGAAAAGPRGGAPPSSRRPCSRRNRRAAPAASASARTVQMHDESGAAPAVTTPDDGRELVPVRQPGCDRQHRDPAIRRRAARGPCRGGRR